MSVVNQLHLQGNKRRLYKYNIYQSFDAGLALPSRAVGEILNKSPNLLTSYVKEIGSELYLLNFLDQKLKLLLHRREINKIIELSKKEKYVILPGNLYLRNRRIKVEIHLCKYNRNAEKEKKNKKYNRSAAKSLLIGSSIDY